MAIIKMTHTMQKSIVIIFISLISVSGSLNKVRPETKDKFNFNTILVQFFPSFHENSQILYDNVKKEVTFYRFGSKEYLLPPSHPKDSLEPWYDPNVEVVRTPKCNYYQLSDKEFKYLNDSILNHFTQKELKDSTIDMHDGIFVTMFVTFKDERPVKEIELSNALNQNHRKYLDYLIDLTIKTNNDSITLNYLKRLNKYWN